jgi:hypothetical protein
MASKAKKEVILSEDEIALGEAITVAKSIAEMAKDLYEEWSQPYDLYTVWSYNKVKELCERAEQLELIIDFGNTDKEED